MEGAPVAEVEGELREGSMVLGKKSKRRRDSSVAPGMTVGGVGDAVGHVVDLHAGPRRSGSTAAHRAAQGDADGTWTCSGERVRIHQERRSASYCETSCSQDVQPQ